MKAIRVEKFGSNRVLKINTLPIPKPDRHQVLVKTYGIGINPVETYIRSGNYARLPNLPYTPGSDAVGKVHAVGDQVENFKIGDTILVGHPAADLNPGAYSEYFTLSEKFGVRVPESDNITDLAAFAVPYFTAYRALEKGGLTTKTKRLLVHGASGGVGMVCVQLAKILNPNIKITATCSSNEAENILKDLGADKCLNHRENGYLNDEEPFDLIIEMLANVNLDRDMKKIGRNGKIVIVGNRGEIQVCPRDIMATEASVIGCVLWNMSVEEMTEAGKKLSIWLEQKKLKPIIDRHFGFTDAGFQDAHEFVISSEKLSKGKVIIKL